MATLTRRSAAAAVPIQRPLPPDLLGFLSAPLTSSPPTLTASPAIRNGVIVLLAAAALLAAYGASVRLGPALADEFIDLSGARHLPATDRLGAGYYDASRILPRGYPHQHFDTPG